MTAERHIDYDALAQGAMRAVVRAVLVRVAKTGLPGEHHFYIAFNTQAPGVILSKRLSERYPEEMTVVLQHRFWDLIVTEERFEVKLTFDNIPERLVVPFASIKVFFDPSVPYGMQFEESDLMGATQLENAPGAGSAANHGPRLAPEPSLDRAPKAEKKPRTPKRAPADAAAGKDAPPDSDKAPKIVPAAPKAVEPAPARPGTKIVNLDAFRKK
jgi:uncharacterized protein